MADESAIALIEEQAEERIRRTYFANRWYFSVIDVVGLLTDAPTPRMYWADMKRTIHAEGFVQLLERIQQLKMPAKDGRMRATDAADLETTLRIIQSVPSPKAEPIKQWLAKVGAQQLGDVAQPLPPAGAREAAAAVPRPPQDAPAMAWAEYYEALAAIYRRTTIIESTLAEHSAQLDELHSRMEGAEEGLRMLIEQLGPATLSPEHWGTVKAQVKRLHEVGGYAYSTIYSDLAQSFHVGKAEQIPEERWPEVARWFQTRVTAAEQRRR